MSNTTEDVTRFQKNLAPESLTLFWLLDHKRWQHDDELNDYIKILWTRPCNLKSHRPSASEFRGSQRVCPRSKYLILKRINSGWESFSLFATTNCQNTWDTVSYFALNRMSMIYLYLWCPSCPYQKFSCSKLSGTTLIGGEGGGEYVLYLTDLRLAAIWSKKGRFFLYVSSLCHAGSEKQMFCSQHSKKALKMAIKLNLFFIIVFNSSVPESCSFFLHLSAFHRAKTRSRLSKEVSSVNQQRKIRHQNHSFC